MIVVEDEERRPEALLPLNAYRDVWRVPIRAAESLSEL
jgi:hypothetical protein